MTNEQINIAIVSETSRTDVGIDYWIKSKGWEAK